MVILHIGVGQLSVQRSILWSEGPDYRLISEHLVPMVIHQYRGAKVGDMNMHCTAICWKSQTGNGMCKLLTFFTELLTEFDILFLDLQYEVIPWERNVQKGVY